jgi:hypothetical protein
MGTKSHRLEAKSERYIPSANLITHFDAWHRIDMPLDAVIFLHAADTTMIRRDRTSKSRWKSSWARARTSG